MSNYENVKLAATRQAEKDIVNMTNDILMEEYMNLVRGDDYDGCFTTQGDARFQVISREFYDRLYKEGFIENPIK